jgi:hypothetical protein
VRPDIPLWTYCHPWEFDPGESFHKLPEVGWFTTIVSYMGRRGMYGHIEAVLAGGVGPRLGDLVVDPVFVRGLPEVPVPEGPG